MSNWSFIKNNILPLDIIFFRGTDPVSKLICSLQKQRLGRGDYSHVAVVVNSEILPSVPQLKPGELYVWESTMSKELFGITDGVRNINNKGVFGVQIRNLKNVIEAQSANEGTVVAWGKLINNPWVNNFNKQEIIMVMEHCLREYGSQNYDVNCLNLIGALFPQCRKVRNGLETVLDNGYDVLRSINLVDGDGPEEWLFCSELVASIFQQLNIIDKNKESRNVVPMDFLGCDEDGIPRLCSDPEVIIFTEGFSDI